MKHNWQSGLCLVCGFYCDQCNDCKCPGKGWKQYARSSCPQFDTHGGKARPEKSVVAYQHWVDNMTYLYGPGSESYERGRRRQERYKRDRRNIEIEAHRKAAEWANCENPY